MRVFFFKFFISSVAPSIYRKKQQQFVKVLERTWIEHLISKYFCQLVDFLEKKKKCIDTAT